MKPAYYQTFLLMTLLLITACSPKVQVVAPDQPITINLNIKIDHEVRIKIEEDLKDVISEDSPLF